MSIFFDSGLFTVEEVKKAAAGASAADKIRSFFSEDMFCSGLIMRSPIQYFEINHWMKVHRRTGINGNDVLGLSAVGSSSSKDLVIDIPIDEALTFDEVSNKSVVIRFDGNVKYSIIKLRPVGGR